MGDLDRLRQLPGEVAELLGPVDILVVNTGGPPPGGGGGMMVAPPPGMMGGGPNQAASRRYTITLSLSASNVLNHVNLGQPNVTVTAAQGGSITSTHIFPPAGSARTGQLFLRWNY
jgi:NAD(P)-dependent dehydrogenase (short-subunit alcohol dehydrogenase family)